MIAFLGVDIAGKNNTWACVLESDGRNHNRVLKEAPQKESILSLTEFVQEESYDLAGVAIDAPLTWAVDPAEEGGFRSSDLELKQMLASGSRDTGGLNPGYVRSWVMSSSSMHAVPLRGSRLAELLGPDVGTIIETHPRACLWFFCQSRGKPLRDVYLYKKNGEMQALRRLWDGWADAFEIKVPRDIQINHDGQVDALVCATVACLFHQEPARLKRLKHTATDRRGRGPFYVVAK